MSLTLGRGVETLIKYKSVPCSITAIKLILFHVNSVNANYVHEICSQSDLKLF